MACVRSKKRELALQIIYSLEFNKKQDLALMSLLSEMALVPKSACLAALELSLDIISRTEHLDRIIASICDDYDIMRISPLVKSILRILISEYLYGRMSYMQILQEGATIAARYGDSSQAGFVHAVLTNIKLL